MNVLHLDFASSTTTAGTVASRIGFPPAPRLDLNRSLVLVIQRLGFHALELQKIVNSRHRKTSLIEDPLSVVLHENPDGVNRGQPSRFVSSPSGFSQARATFTRKCLAVSFFCLPLYSAIRFLQRSRTQLRNPAAIYRFALASCDERERMNRQPGRV